MTFSMRLGLVGLALLAFEPHLARGQVDDPSVADFKRRGYHTSEVLGSYLYIDGGQISQVISGNDSLTVNSTLSLSLAESWSNATVSFQTIDKTSAGAPSLYLGALWRDEDAGVLYSWAGGAENDFDEVNLWKLTPDGTGGGTWTTQAVTNSDSIIRTASGTGVACNGMGYYLGGYGNAATDATVFNGTDQIFVPTWLKYNMTSQVMLNDSSSLPSDIFPGDKTYRSGMGVCLPDYGDNGVVMILGGTAMGEGGDLFSFSNLTFYDIATDTWFRQQVPLDQGETVPGTRELSCAVAVAGPNGTYDIFMHGGNGGSPVQGMSDTWVLTLPAFRWISAPMTSSARRVHSCSLVGNSQMVVVGGAGPTDDDLWSSVDNLDQGLGIIDLSTLSWNDQFDADAFEYTPPQSVTDIYDLGGQELVVWTSDEIETIFMSAAMSSTAAKASSSSSAAWQAGSTTPVGAIAGGVVGGVAVLAIAGALIFLCLRRRRRNAQQAKDNMRTTIEHNSAGGYQDASSHYDPAIKKEPEMAGDWFPSELSGAEHQQRQELPSKHIENDRTAEMPGAQAYELP